MNVSTRAPRRVAAPALALAALLTAQAACERQRPEATVEPQSDDASVRDRLDGELTPRTSPEPRTGLAAVVLIDVSGSMSQRVRGADGRDERKIVAARRAAASLVDEFARYAKAHPGRTVELGLYEFSSRRGVSPVREVVPLGVPDPERAAMAIAGLQADGGTPIGSALIEAKRLLDGTGLTRRHLLVITDGENTDGDAPGDVARAIARRPPSEQLSLYFVAFDIEASRFNAVREAGGLVLGAANAKELGATLDALLSDRILIEK